MLVFLHMNEQVNLSNKKIMQSVLPQRHTTMSMAYPVNTPHTTEPRDMSANSTMSDTIAPDVNSLCDSSNYVSTCCQMIEV